MEGPVRIAIADDNVEFCHLLVDYLKRYPRLEVVGVAHEGLRALKLIKEMPVDVLLLDMIMPNIDGIGVLERLRYAHLPRRPRVIVFTAFGQEEMTRKAVRLGADYYILKPFDLAILVQRIMEIARVLEGDSSYPPIDLEEIERVVTEMVERLRIPRSFKGYFYLREAIFLTALEPAFITEVTKRLYPRIAEKYATTVKRVERAIRFAIETAWAKGEIELLNELFGPVDERKGRPTNASFIAKAADWVRLDSLARQISKIEEG
ncbi:MAG: sporulation transcription factor Spo0A [Firmicutes bacterium]|nr:sporulation transcription factor Spo0A [Bacillota bacterium]